MLKFIHSCSCFSLMRPSFITAPLILSLLLSGCSSEDETPSGDTAVDAGISSSQISSITRSSLNSSLSSALSSSVNSTMSSSEWGVSSSSAQSSLDGNGDVDRPPSTDAKRHRVLTVRVEYEDVPFPQDLEEMTAGNAEVAQFFTDASYGAVALDFFHHPHIITTPNKKEHYNSDELWSDNFYYFAKNTIAGAGYIKGTDYDFLHVFFPETDVRWWGNYFGETNQSAYMNMFLGRHRRATVAHETGHIFGLGHADALVGFPETEIIGDHLQSGFDGYGDDYDVMGGGGMKATLNVEYKRRLGWIDEEDILNVTQDGTYRIYAHDTPVKPNGPVGIKIQTSVKNPSPVPKFKDDVSYVMEYRVNLNYDDELDIQARRGLGVRLVNYTRESTMLLDMHPETKPLKSGLKYKDATLEVGEKYIDELDDGLFSIEILGVNEGVWDHNGYIDVKVEFLRRFQ